MFASFYKKNEIKLILSKACGEIKVEIIKRLFVSLQQKSFLKYG